MKIYFQKNITSNTLTNIMSMHERINEAQKYDANYLKNG